MPSRTRVDFDTVRRIALALRGVEESTVRGSPALKASGRLLAVIPIHKSAEPDSLAVTVDFDRRAELLAAAPETYYIKEHYLSYPVVLVRLGRIDQEALRDLLKGALQVATARKRPAKRVRRQSSDD